MSLLSRGPSKAKSLRVHCKIRFREREPRQPVVPTRGRIPRGRLIGLCRM